MRRSAVIALSPSMPSAAGVDRRAAVRAADDRAATERAPAELPGRESAGRADHRRDTDVQSAAERACPRQRVHTSKMVCAGRCTTRILPHDVQLLFGEQRRNEHGEAVRVRIGGGDSSRRCPPHRSSCRRARRRRGSPRRAWSSREAAPVAAEHRRHSRAQAEVLEQHDLDAGIELDEAFEPGAPCRESGTAMRPAR